MSEMNSSDVESIGLLSSFPYLFCECIEYPYPRPNTFMETFNFVFFVRRVNIIIGESESDKQAVPSLIVF